MKQELDMMNQDFKTWFKGECNRQVGHLEMLNHADRISRGLLKKPLSECWTYEIRYIAKMIAKGIF
jgi:hypothetical protein